MASLPALTDGKIEPWGPGAERHQVRAQRIVDLVAARLGLSIDAAGELIVEPGARADYRRYAVLRQLGASSRAVVYLAIDQMLAREVALKIYTEPATGHSRWKVFEEARTQGAFDHPHVVRIFDVGEHAGLTYMVSELCDADMSQWAPGRPWRAVVRRIVEAGRGLELLHARGLVHCDVKPANILVKDGVAKVGDFGLSARAGPATRLAGTAGFIAPELALGFRTPAADVFGLAVSAWVCLFGELPFEPPTEAEEARLDAGEVSAMVLLLERARHGRLVEAPAGSEVPGAVVEAVCAGLAAVPQRRMGMGEWLRRLEEICEEPRARRGRRWVPSFAAGMAVGGVCAAGVTLAVMLPPEVENTPAVDSGVSGGQAASPSVEEVPPPAEFVSYKIRRETEAIDPNEARALAEKFMAEAESADSAASIVMAKAARYVAADLRLIAEQAGDERGAAIAKDIMARADRIIRTGK